MPVPGLFVEGIPAGGAGGGAPVDAQYVVLVGDATLTQERILTGGSGIGVTDGGANNPVTLALSTLTADWNPGAAFKISNFGFDMELDSIRFGNAAGPLLDGGAAGDDLALTGELDISGHAAIGANAAILGGRVLSVMETADLGAGTTYGIYVDVRQTRSSSSAMITGIGGYALHQATGTGNTNVAFGLDFSCIANSSRNVNTVTGCQVDARSFAGQTGTLGDAYCFRIGAQANRWAGALPGEFWGFKIPDLTVDGSGAIDVYGIQIDAFDAVATNIRWPFFYGDVGSMLMGIDYLGIIIPPTYTNATRPAANTVTAGGIIYNSDDAGLNISDGANWRGPNGGWANT